MSVRCLIKDCHNTLADNILFYEDRFCTSCIRDKKWLLTRAKNLKAGDLYKYGEGESEHKVTSIKNNLIMYKIVVNNATVSRELEGFGSDCQMFVLVKNPFKKDW